MKTAFFCFCMNRMGNKIVILVIVVWAVVVGFVKAVPFEQKDKFSDLTLSNIEALAEKGDENQSEKKYSYVVWEANECYVLVGGAYAKGKQVTCSSGSEHPICVSCKL
ncbi:MAG: hypothetical protein IKU98_03285 [Bacteroidaceae bacterium]|nr:hypothetical protein [Bacteroidaceae bacterium]